MNLYSYQKNTKTALPGNNLSVHTVKFYLYVHIITLLIISIIFGKNQVLPIPPKTQRVDVNETIHGIEVVDPYRWLEDGDSAETREWINTQKEYTQRVIGSLPRREELKQRLTELMRVDHVEIPQVRNGRYFFEKQSANQELPVICFRKGLNGQDEVLVDPHPMSSDNSKSVNMLDISDDGTLMAYAIRQGGEDEIIIKLFDVDKQKDLSDYLPKARYMSFSLKSDKTGFYYVRHEACGQTLLSQYGNRFGR